VAQDDPQTAAGLRAAFLTKRVPQEIDAFDRTRVAARAPAVQFGSRVPADAVSWRVIAASTRYVGWSSEETCL